MRVSRAVVLVIDRLGAPWVGPYGNTWLDTPNFNRLAAHSLLIETAISDSPDLDVHCRSLWTGQHAMESVPSGRPLPALAQQAGGAARLLTDHPQIASHRLAAQFHDRRLLTAPTVTEPAQQADETAFFQFFDAARNAVEQFSGPGLLCLYSRGMSGAWDAPLELRYQFADELDPDPPSFVDPPNRQLEAGHDPDELLGIVQAYAGQVALADMCLGPFLDAFESHPLASETLLVVTSPRGFPLGEHRRMGPCDDALYGELLHVPLFVRLPDHEAARLQTIVQPHKISRLIAEACDWARSGHDGESTVLDQLAASPSMNVSYALGQDERAIRTPAWFLRQANRDGSPAFELFAKPDDRWEANEVSSRCGDVVELLAAELQRFHDAAAAGGQPSSPAALPDELCDIWR